ncbi:MAG: S41 family peptidase, partial [Clostridia bacterium]|nr:S41 family peptidase [Clostridia bacterium]
MFYYEEMDKSEAANTAIEGVAVSTRDPYTDYMWGEDAADYMEHIEGNYCGVGLYIEYDMENNLISVVSAIAGGPAEAAGITTGDKILKIDGEIYLGSQLSEAASYMKGEEGTEVTLTIRSAADGAEKDVKLIRSEIEIASVTGKMLEDKIGYVSLTQFTEDMDVKFAEECTKLSMQGMKGLIIDVRNNPGGLLDEAINIASIFVPDGEIVTYTMDKYEDKTEYKATEIGDDLKIKGIPIVILTNGGSASASEVLSGALKDYGIATLVGEKTFGKGVVQSVIPVFDGILSVTTARYYTPNGVCIHGEGIKPDVEVPMDAEKSATISTLPVEEDDQLLAAIEHLKSK